MTSQSYDHEEEKAVRVAVALTRAVALSEELQSTVLELATTLRSSGTTTKGTPVIPGEIQK